MVECGQIDSSHLMVRTGRAVSVRPGAVARFRYDLCRWDKRVRRFGRNLLILATGGTFYDRAGDRFPHSMILRRIATDHDSHGFQPTD